MLKIVQMVPALGWGGAQVFCIQLCNELVNKYNHEVTLVSLYHHTSEHLPLELLDKRIRFVTLGKSKGFDTKMFFKVQALLKELQPDIVNTHLHSSYYCFLAYMTLKKPFKKFHTFHSMVKIDSPWHGREAYKYFFRKRIIRPISISEEVYKSAVEEYGQCIRILIKNGTSPVRPTAAFEEVNAKILHLKKNADTKILLNVARICKEKNQILLMEAMLRLEQENINVICLILGDYAAVDKPLYDQLLSIKPGNVHFLGKVKNVADYLMNSDAFVLTSTFEGLPISLLEALSAKVIPVCTPAGGIVNVVNDKVGFVSSSMSTEDYYHSLKTFLSLESNALEEMQKAGRKLFEEEYSMALCASEYNKLYHS
jgi:glycosyltransferase involved in cell wall biosynthesis